VCSSTIVRILIGRPLAVWSFTKSYVHTWSIRVARCRVIPPAAVPKAGVHMTIAGSAVLPIGSPGQDVIQLEVLRDGGTGNYIADVNDGVSGTIIQIKQ